MISKKSFIEYVLFHYDFIGEDAVYVLNYLKFLTNFDCRVSFIDSDREIKISIAEKKTNRKGLMLITGDRVLLKAEEILKFLEKNDSLIYLSFDFNPIDIKYTELLFSERNEEKTEIQFKKINLLKNVEYALLTKNKELFLKLTTELKKLDEENLHALHEE